MLVICMLVNAVSDFDIAQTRFLPVSSVVLGRRLYRLVVFLLRRITALPRLGFLSDRYCRVRVRGGRLLDYFSYMVISIAYDAAVCCSCCVGGFVHFMLIFFQ